MRIVDEPAEDGAVKHRKQVERVIEDDPDLVVKPHEERFLGRSRFRNVIERPSLLDSGPPRRRLRRLFASCRSFSLRLKRSRQTRAR